MLVDILSNACIFFTIAVFSTGIPQCREIIMRKDTGSVPFLPFIMTCINNVIWILYSSLIKNFTVFIVNFIGVILQLVYICVYLHYSNFKVTELRMVGVAIIFVSLMIFYTYTTTDIGFATNVTGIVCNIVTILMFSSPLAELKSAMRDKSTKSISFPLTVATFFCTLLWTIYGLIINDTYLIVPNALGLLTSFPRFYLFARYRAQYQPDLAPKV